MPYLVHAWQFVASHLSTWVTAALLGLVLFVKRKVIASLISRASKWVETEFFGWFAKKLPRQENHPHEKTYRGQFYGFSQYANPPREWFFRVIENGVEHTIPTYASNLLSGVSPGTLVEIDTIRFVDRQFETITRVRVISKTA